MRFINAIALMLLPIQAWSTDVTLGTHTSVGPNTFIEDVSGSGDFGPDEIWNWDLDYTFTRSADPSTSTTNGSTLVDTTKDFRGGMGWYEDGWTVAGTGEHAVTPDENLTNTGGLVSVSRRFKYGVRGETGFQPSWSVGLDLGGNSYRQVFSGTVHVTKKKTKPITGENLLDQKSAKLRFNVRPLHAWAFKVSGTAYGYNRNVADFESYLNSNAAANRGMASLSGAVGGLPASQLAIGAKWYFADDWDLNTEFSRSVLAADGSLSTVTRVQTEWEPNESWHLALGIEQDNSEGVSERLTLFSLEYTF